MISPGLLPSIILPRGNDTRIFGSRANSGLFSGALEAFLDFPIPDVHGGRRLPEPRRSLSFFPY